MKQITLQIRPLRLLILLLALFLCNVILWAQQGIQIAPLNPTFLDYLQAQKREVNKFGLSGHGMGEVPAPMDISYLKSSQIRPLREINGSPTSYDLRVLGRLTPIRNQESAGSCWAFATYASFESCALPGANYDLSENNMKNRHGFDLAHDAGGNNFMSTAYLTRWDGPISELDDPYNPLSGVSPSGLSPMRHMQNVIFLPGRANSIDNEFIKQAVMTYGATYSSYYHDDSNYRAATYAYYNSTTTTTNHAIAIVGWDDNFPATNFKTQPAGNGAFLIRNNWGTSWGDSGYFYISYYDVSLGKTNAVFYQSEATTNYNHIYQYDPLGWVGNSGYSVDTAWMAAVYTASSAQQLNSVGMYAVANNASYEIYIYRNPTSGPIGTGPVSTVTGSFVNAGYYTVPLTTPVALASGERFSVVIKIITPGYNFPIPIEYVVSGYSSLATASPGQTYLRKDGPYGWSDATVISASCNICIKAYTSDISNPPVAQNDSYQLAEDGSLTVPADGVLDNDSADSGKSLTAVLLTDVAHGTLILQTTGAVSYTPDADYFGEDTFTYKANDTSQDSNVATVTITVTSVNDTPSFTNGANIAVARNSGSYSAAWATNISPGPANEAGQTVQFAVSNDNNALFSVQPAISLSGVLSFTPADNKNGTATVTVTITDNGGTENGGIDNFESTFIVDVVVSNTAPVANSQNVRTIKETAKTITLTAADVDGDTLSYSVETNPTHGTLSGTAPNLTYTPFIDFTGNDSFTFTVYDGTDYSVPATVSISVLTPSTLQPDLWLRHMADTVYYGDNIYSADGVTQRREFSVLAASTAYYYLRLQNDGSAADTLVLKVPAAPVGWTVKYFTFANVEVTAAVTGAEGWSTGVLAVGANDGIYIKVTPDNSISIGTTLTLIPVLTSTGDGTKKDVGQLLTTVIAMQPDLWVRNSVDAVYYGDNIYSADGATQRRELSVSGGSAVYYYLRMQNDGSAPDTLKLKALTAPAGWTVKYFTFANVDVTAEVNGAGWSTGVLAVGANVGVYVQVLPDNSIPPGNILTLKPAVTSAGDVTKKDVGQLVTTVIAMKPDLWVRTIADSIYYGDNIYSADGATQRRDVTLLPGLTTIYYLRMQNDGTAADTLKLKALAAPAGWTVKYFTFANVEVTAAVAGAAGWSTGVLAVGSNVGIYIKVTPNASTPPGAMLILKPVLTSTVDVTKKDVGQLVTTVEGVQHIYQPDMWVRSIADAVYYGDNIYSADGTTQHRELTIRPGSNAYFYLRLQNDGTAADTFILKSTAATAGWIVKYFTFANVDVTDAVIGAVGWSTGLLSVGANVGMYARVTPTSSLFPGASILLTPVLTSTVDGTKKDVGEMLTMVE